MERTQLVNRSKAAFSQDILPTTHHCTPADAVPIFAVVGCTIVVGILFIVFIEAASEGELKAVEAQARAELKIEALQAELTHLRKEKMREHTEHIHQINKCEKLQKQWAAERQELLGDFQQTEYELLKKELQISDTKERESQPSARSIAAP